MKKWKFLKLFEGSSKSTQIHFSQGACIIKLIMAVIYSFRNKLECFSLNIKLGWERLARDKHSSLLRKYVNYGHNKFYDTGFWS